MSESSTATVPASKSKNGPLQKTVKCKLFCSSGDKCDSREPAEDGVWLISDDLEDLDELDDDAKPLISLLSGKNAKKVVQAAKKRLCKPTKRYIEELSDTQSKHEMERQIDLSAISKDKHPKIRYNTELHCGGAFLLLTTPEVLKLIDGIAQYGTGRWTDIKKLMLSSTAYRTRIDLRVPIISPLECQVFFLEETYSLHSRAGKVIPLPSEFRAN
ncbi:hypothetical protein SADUNF_Sadunf16G0081100 [Salix dunnii]|uniref:Uncharacterized protein n=1 Tax=Salix dunnii TaxID=1413687 RepID=A0A835MIK0_9ROSI|nr:hypothetical protein SADUNF_Sadunf16G0081100 [Salix dunnii]